MEKLRERLQERPPLFAAVGDFVARNAIEAGLEPDIIVIDGKTLRTVVQDVKHDLEEKRVVNPPATIQASAWRLLRDAITLKRKAAVIVEGEEDLLVLPLMADAPFGSVIIYGQPHEGVVAVKVTGERRRWARNFISRMEITK